ncbi:MULTISPECIES: fused MFS/spermidine synthase [unclassified Ensifer]|uniref:fused MFS/spermidine synthase n=1 Tax=unclassified Ensifer TaxID=2633371 RepID=UPI000A5616AE|nr:MULTISPECIES: fused MFS/spermidine synthase [unclassified Ensifer]
MTTKNSPFMRTTALAETTGDPLTGQRIQAFRPAIAAFMLFLSGTAALIFQVLWIKQLSLITGVDVYAVSVGVSAFFLGLALGSFVLGRAGDRSRQPFRFYALLETGVAVLGAGVTIALSRIAPLFVAIESTNSFAAWSLLILVIAAPAFLMGGTLPVLLRALDRAPGGVGAKGGRLYAANTLGAIVGCLAVSFVIIPALGVQATGLAAAGLGVAAAAIALSTRAPVALNYPTDAAATSALAKPGSRLALVLYAIAGGIALGYEVAWSQAIVQFISTRSFAFSLVLATYLAGLALGAALFARRTDRLSDPWGTFGLLVALAGFVGLAELAVLGPWLTALQTSAEAAVAGITGSIFAGMSARFLIAALTIVFVPTLILGAAFPVALRLAVDPDHAGRDTGRVLALNTLGGIAGTLLTGFVLIPAFGIIRSFATLAVAAAAVGLIAVSRGRDGWSSRRLVTPVLGILTVLIAIMVPSERLAGLLNLSRGNGTIVSYEEGLGATVAVIEQGQSERRFRRLYIQGVSNTGDAMPSLRYMRLQALLPLLIHKGEPKSALVIGLGTGITAGSLLAYPDLDRRVAAELLPSVARASALFSGNFNAVGDGRLEIRVADGRRELLRSTDRYDLITLEPPPPSAAGVVNLYSSDFYRLARARLAANGLVAQWLPIATQNDEDTQALVRSFLDSFPHTSLWSTELHEMLLVGSAEPQELDAGRIAERMATPSVAAALSEVGVAGVPDLLATWMTDRAGLEHYAASALPVTDDQPRIEYAGWVRPDELQRTLPALVALRSKPPLVGADKDLEKSVTGAHDRLMLFYQASLNAYAGYRAEWARDMELLMRVEPGNPYYRWFVSSSEH